MYLHRFTLNSSKLDNLPSRHRFYNIENRQLETPTHMKDYVRELIAANQTKPEVIFEELNNLKQTSKGLAFEEFVAELYRGNGYISVVSGGRGDSGADVLLYAQNNASQVLRIIQTKNHISPVSYDSARTELRKFEEESSKRYNCREYELISINGFTQGLSDERLPKTLRRYNLLLSDWKSLIPLIRQYDPTHQAQAELSLKSHNQDTFGKVEELFQRHQKVCAIQATGTGKRYLAGKYLLSRANKRVLFLSPSIHINNQQKALLPHANCEYETYQSLNRLIALPNNGHYDCIIVDEFHRLGAKKWGSRYKKLLSMNPEAEVFGLTATPLRDLDNERDMKKELFNDVCANEIPLHEAIVRRILPTPLYVTATREIESEISRVENNLRNSNLTQGEIRKHRRSLNRALKLWDRSRGVPQILAKHLPCVEGKYYVFCENREHLESSIEEVRSWLRGAAKSKNEKINQITDIAIHCRMTKSQIDKAVRSAKAPLAKGEVRLIFSVNILNEGVHWEDVTKAILLRQTESRILHHQQIGRCFHSGSEETPIIFDLTSNINLVGTKSFNDKLQEALSHENKLRASVDLHSIDFEFQVSDDQLDLILELRDIEQQITSWESGYKRLKSFHEMHGHCMVPRAYCLEGMNLYNWLSRQRRHLLTGRLSETNRKKLESLNVGFASDLALWCRNYKRAKAFFTKTRRFPTRQEMPPEFALWVEHSTRLHAKQRLCETSQDLLNQVGFVWCSVERTWQEHLRAALDFKVVQHPEVITHDTTHQGLNIGSWVFKTNVEKKLGKLSQHQIDEYTRVGLSWGLGNK